MSDADPLLFEERQSVLWITINRPEARNALQLEMVNEIEDRLIAFERSSSLHVAIITGSGDQAFCAGGDLKSALPRVTSGASTSARRNPTRRTFMEVTKPTIAAVNGSALAGGFELVLGTDLRVAADHAKFGLPEPRWGLFPGAGGTVRLPRQVPWARAMEMLLIGDTITAQEALAFGLVNRVVPGGQVAETAARLADRLLQNGPLAVRRIKESMISAYGAPWQNAFCTESALAASVFASEDAKEGPRAFAEKRPPNFIGR